VLPQAFFNMLPALAGRYVVSIKNTSLAFLIGLAELTEIGKQIGARVIAAAGGAEKLARAYPLGRIGEPIDIANAVLFFASPLSSWITGQILSVSGGYTMV
jgi:NAD(P)-dependent dehydrogenase (short-subunit alcohol dehydrogenase family)